MKLVPLCTYCLEKVDGQSLDGKNLDSSNCGNQKDDTDSSASLTAESDSLPLQSHAELHQKLSSNSSLDPNQKLGSDPELSCKLLACLKLYWHFRSNILLLQAYFTCKSFFLRLKHLVFDVKWNKG